MYISTQIDSFSKLGDLRTILTTLKEVGFTAYDFSMFISQHTFQNGAMDTFIDKDDYIERAKSLRSFSDELGLPCNQTHAPFPSVIPENQEFNEKMLVYLKRAIEVSGILGAKVCVIHPCQWYKVEGNVAFYLQLENVAREAGVKIGVENMYAARYDENGCRQVISAACSNHDDFNEHLSRLPEDVFCACLDIGHAEMKGLGTSASQMIESLGDRLQAIHLHDIDLIEDSHSIPFSQKIDYAKIIESFKKIKYKGDITLEAISPFYKLPKELIKPALAYAAAVANYFKKQIQ